MEKNATKGLTSEDILHRLHSGQECSQPIFRDTKIRKNPWCDDLAWRFPDGSIAAASAVSKLKKRGLVAISHGVLFRYLLLVRKESSCAGT